MSSSVQGLVLYCLFLDVPHKQHGRVRSDISNEEATFPFLLSPKHSHSTVLLKDRPMFEKIVRKCVSQRCGFMVSDRTMGPIILAETYSIPTLTSCNGTYMDQYGIWCWPVSTFIRVLVFTEFEPVFTAETECGACFSIINTKEIPVLKISLGFQLMFSI